MVDWAIIGEGTIVPRILSIREQYDPFRFANNSFSKIQSMNRDRDGFVSQSCARYSKFI
jgi:hypothetical protein